MMFHRFFIPNRVGEERERQLSRAAARVSPFGPIGVNAKIEPHIERTAIDRDLRFAFGADSFVDLHVLWGSSSRLSAIRKHLSTVPFRAILPPFILVG